MNASCVECGEAPKAERRRVCRACRNAQKRDYRNTVRGRAAVLCGEAKRRADKAGVEFSLTREWVAERLQRGTCEVTGLPFDMSRTGHSTTGLNPNRSPSIHRFRPTGGYTPENCVLVVWAVNEMAGKYEPGTLTVIFRHAARYYAERCNL